MGKKPPLIYKYATLDDLPYFLTNNTLKFTCPLEFNDPFDCDVDLLDFDFSVPVTQKVADEVAILKKRFKVSADSQFWEQAYKGGASMRVKNSRICCFSLHKDIVLMWSHYANKHSGVCLEFDNTMAHAFVNLTDKDVFPGQVSYKAHKRINYVAEERDHALYKLFLNKSISWQSEQEYRLITMDGKADKQKFNPKYLLSITFGLKVGDTQINAIINNIDKTLFGHLKYYKAKKDNLGLQFVELEF